MTVLGACQGSATVGRSDWLLTAWTRLALWHLSTFTTGVRTCGHFALHRIACNATFHAFQIPSADFEIKCLCVSACKKPTILLKEAGLQGSYDCVELAHICAGESHLSWPRVPRAIVMRLMRSTELRAVSSLRMSSIIVFNCSTMSFDVPKMSILL
jgi:hypothetical protein